LTASKDEFEAIWIEIEGNNKQNMTCGLVYRHPIMVTWVVLPNVLIINIFSCLTSNIKIYKRDYSKYNETDLINQVEAINWQNLFLSHGAAPSNMFDSFYSEISSIIDKNIPIKVLSRKERKVQSKPWVTPGIRKSIHIKNMYKKYLKTKSQKFYSRFKK
jgi:hypothetical protein